MMQNNQTTSHSPIYPPSPVPIYPGSRPQEMTGQEDLFKLYTEEQTASQSPQPVPKKQSNSIYKRLFLVWSSLCSCLVLGFAVFGMLAAAGVVSPKQSAPVTQYQQGGTVPQPPDTQERQPNYSTEETEPDSLV